MNPAEKNSEHPVQGSNQDSQENKTILDTESGNNGTTSILKKSESTVSNEQNPADSPTSPSKSILKQPVKENHEKKKSVAFTLQAADGNKGDEYEEEKSGANFRKKKLRSKSEEQKDNETSPILSKKKDSNTSFAGLEVQTVPVVHNLSVGKVQDGIAVLLSEDFNIIEMPLSVLPPDVRKGNILKITIERNIAEEEARKESIKSIQREIMNNTNLFDNFNRKLDYFKNKKMQLLQASNKGVPNVQGTIDAVIGTLKDTALIDETIDNDRIMVRPQAVTDIRLEKPVGPVSKPPK
jgi:Protein of unknown function (DUF3006).